MSTRERLVLDPEPKGDGCFSCKHLSRGTESWEMPHIWWYECGARPANESLRGFPWRVTKCKLRVARSEGLQLRTGIDADAQKPRGRCGSYSSKVRTAPTVGGA